MALTQVGFQFTATRIQALVDGATVTADLGRGDVIHFSWSGPVSRSVRLKAQQRLATMIRRFNTVIPEGTRQLSLLNEAP